MQTRRVITVVLGAALCLGAIAAAQGVPRVLAHADEVDEQPRQTTFTGNVSLSVDGVFVRADRAVIQNGEATFEGNVRVTLPKGARVSIVKELRSRPLSSEPVRELIPPPPGSQP